MIPKLPKDDDVVDVTQSNSQTNPMTHIQISLDSYKQLIDFMKLKYLHNEDAVDKNLQKEIELIFKLGLICVRESLYSNDSPLLHNGEKPRGDVWKKLGNVALEFLKCSSYPKIPVNQLISILKKALKVKDKRTIKEYEQTVLIYCNISEQAIEKNDNSKSDELDVDLFVKLIPRQYVASTTSSSSSSDDEESEDEKSEDEK